MHWKPHVPAQTGIAFGGALHEVPHLPQFEVSPARFTHDPPQLVWVPQSAVHSPALHTVPTTRRDARGTSPRRLTQTRIARGLFELGLCVDAGQHFDVYAVGEAELHFAAFEVQVLARSSLAIASIKVLPNAIDFARETVAHISKAA